MSAATPFNSRSSEQGMLTDMKPSIEALGPVVLGFPVRWDVENLMVDSAKRPDAILFRDESGEILVSGEAKRPHTAAGAHPLVASEVTDALAKAQYLGAPLCFTTNFFEIALWRATPGPATQPERLIDVIPLVSPDTAQSDGWWKELTAVERRALVEDGLRRLLEAMKSPLLGGGRVPTINEVVLSTLTHYTNKLVEHLSRSLRRHLLAGSLAPEVPLHAARVGLDLEDSNEARYLVAQGVAEVITSVLFYRNIADHFGLDPILAGTDPSTPNALRTRVTKSLERATAASGDYDTIFDLSFLATWLLGTDHTGVVSGWKALLSFVDSLDFEAIDREVLGTIFERLISTDRRRDMGQHYTQPRIADAILRWADLQDGETIADISCGAGTFLVSSYNTLGRKGDPHEEILSRIFGNDLDSFAVHLAAVNLATRDIFRGANYPLVRRGDAFDLRPGEQVLDVHPLDGATVQRFWPDAGVDVIVGNPPYDERPAHPEAWKAAVTKLRHDVFPRGLTGGNQAAWFAVLSTALMPDGQGRWGLVLPTGVLQNENLRIWRSWLRSRYDVTIWYTDTDVWFSDARVGTCVVLASPPLEGQTPSTRFVELVAAVEGVDQLDHDDLAVPVPRSSARETDLSEVELGDDLLIPGIMPTELKQFIGAEASFPILATDRVRAKYGNKKGHPTYALKDKNPNGGGAIRSLESGGLEAQLNRDFLVPFLSGPKDESTGEFRPGSHWLLDLPEDVSKSGALANYLRGCERLGVMDAPSIRPYLPAWWSREWSTSQIAISLHPGFRHQTWWSDEPFVASNNFHIITFTSGVAPDDRELIAAGLASAFGALASLCISSEVGNEGVRYLTVDQLSTWPILDPAKCSKSSKEAVLRSYRSYRPLDVGELHTLEQDAHNALSNLTKAVAVAAGLTEDLGVAALEAARQICMRRTSRETLALAGRTQVTTTGGGRSQLGRRMARVVDEMPEVGRLLELLTSGEEVLRLQNTSDVEQGVLDLGEMTPEVFAETELVGVLGLDFECAPPISDPSQIAEVVHIALKIQKQVRDHMLPVTDVAKRSAGYLEMRGRVDNALRKQIQDRIRRMMR